MSDDPKLGQHNRQQKGNLRALGRTGRYILFVRKGVIIGGAHLKVITQVIVRLTEAQPNKNPDSE